MTTSRMPPPAHDVSRSVVVAVSPDGADAALRYGAAMAVRADATLHVLHVVDLTPEGGIRERAFAHEAALSAEAVLRDAVAYARALVDEEVPVTSELAHGAVVTRIVAAAADTGIVVLQQPPGTHPRRGGTDICPRVAARAVVPVVCVPATWNGTGGLGTVTVGIDDPETCGPLLREAAAASASLGARLRVLHATTDGAPATAGEDDVRLRIRQALDDVGADAARTTVDVVERPAAGVLREAAHTSELLVVGRHHPLRTGGASLGPLARAAVRRSACPVLLPTPSHSSSSADWVFRSRWA